MGEDEPRGIGLEDLPAIYREGYLYSIEMARAQHDPATDWDGFREYLWDALIRVFGFDAGIEWPSDVPGPVAGSRDKRGVGARHTARFFDESS